MTLSDTQQRPADPLEIWGGVECTVNRVGDASLDQLERSGHAWRLEDVDRFAALGLSALRFPLLWERTAPRGQADWSWSDERLSHLRRAGVRPILGLVHHGGGPRPGGLLDPGFADGLAAYARSVAERYPWVQDYTPVNEPLTTARFSGLYGHWHPHGRDEQTFARTLIHQCRAVALAMRAVRQVNPSARLVQTEDLGKTHSRPALAYQADFENERRWLSFDLLGGRVGREHPLWGFLIASGIGPEELEELAAHPCPPDILGLNYYVTSERFLDDRTWHHRPDRIGGNGRQAYADVEAVRVLPEGLDGPAALLREAWERFRAPLAITEAHLGCTREEQMRWLMELRNAARRLRREGADVRAVTAWALLGAFDWDSLVTRANGHYEPGVFDIRAPRPRPTALAALVADLAAGIEPSHPVLDAPGWWRRPSRLSDPFGGGDEAPEPRVGARQPRPLAILGATGTLGRACARICERRGLPHRLLGRRELDLTDPRSIARALDELRPWAVVNAAGYVRVDDAEREPETCLRANADGPAHLAGACAARGLELVSFSSDLVFGGGRDRPYVEGDPVDPRGVYGRSKAEAERRVLAILPSALVIRAAAFFGPWDEHNFVLHALRTLARGQTFEAASDSVVSPTYVPDLAHATLDLLIDGERGLWHLANAGAVSWADLARRAAARAGLDPKRVIGRPVADFGLAAHRPDYCALGSERGTILPPLDDALGRFLAEGQVDWTGAVEPCLAPPAIGETGSFHADGVAG